MQLDDTLGVCRAATATMIARLNFVDSKAHNRILNQLFRIMKTTAIDRRCLVEIGLKTKAR
jgi:hypothetical protein